MQGHNNGGDDRNIPRREDGKPVPVPRPKNPFPAKPAYYKPDDVIKVWKPDLPKQDQE